MSVEIRVIFSLILAYLECVLFTIIHTGWPSLVYIYKKTRLISQWCPDGSEATRNLSNTTASSLMECPRGDNYLNLIFNITTALHMASFFPFGVLFDRYGILKSKIVALVLFVPGCILLGFANPENLWFLFLGFPMMAMGGKPILIAAQHLPLQLKSVQSVVTSINVGGVFAGAIVFLVFKVLYENYGISLQISFSGLSVLFVVIVFGNGVFLSPRYKVGYGSREEELKKNFQNDEDKVPFTTLLKSVYFWLSTYWAAILYLKYAYNLGTMNPWLTDIFSGDEKKISFYTNLFGYISFGQLLLSPICGIVVDKLRHAGWGNDLKSEPCGKALPMVPSLVAGSLLLIAHSVVSLFNNTSTVVLSFAFHILAAQFQFGVSYTIMRILFPAHAYGKLIGVSFLTIGVFSMFQYALFYAAETLGNYYQVQIFLLFLMMTSLFFPVYILWDYRREMKRMENAYVTKL